MICPSCHRDAGEGVAECPWCGIVFSKWGRSVERPRPSHASEATSTNGGHEPVPREPASAPARVNVLRIALLALAGASILVGGYWFVEIRPRMKRLEDPFYGIEPSRERSLRLAEESGPYFDRRADLPIDPLGMATDGHVVLIANRSAPGGFLRLRHTDDRELRVQTVPVVERAFSQQVSFSAVTWNGSKWVALAMGYWFQRSDDLVFAILDPVNLRIEEVRPAPSLLGCLAWDGSGYWAATRKNTADANEEAWLYRLDANLRVTKRAEPPAVGCQGLAWDGARLWWADVFQDRILVLDVSRDEPQVVHAESMGLGYLSGLALVGRDMWVTEYGDKRLYRLRRALRVAWSGVTADSPMVGTPIPVAPATDAEVRRLHEQLRSDHWAERLRASTRLRELGIPIGYDREQSSFIDREDEEMEMIDWEAEIRDSTIRASWHLWFGHGLFENNVPSTDPAIISVPVFRRYTVGVRGGTLNERIERVFEAIPGDNQMRDIVLVSGIGPGEYEIDCFLHTQYVKGDGTSMILNASAMTLRVEK